MYVSQNYLAGIKEGRKLFTWWQRDGFDILDLLVMEIDSLDRLCRKLAPLAHSKFEIDFLAGQRDFYRHQLKKLGPVTLELFPGNRVGCRCCRLPDLHEHTADCVPWTRSDEDYARSEEDAQRRADAREGFDD